ncbi:hypothetical protein [Streptomyces sp. NP-1717]|uniref:hypothetical protein n=1 Tax=unclassified Streptomyces TaxID=2593676 RepID=UPI001F5DBD02|nr:hypothetical protein [Streptomyces sp. NP-1717]WTA74396.1 hypothetical protein OG705_16760 [Streptomyces sp. NBC_00838]
MRDRQRRDPQERGGGDGAVGAGPDGSRPYADAGPATGPGPTPDSVPDPPPSPAADLGSDESGAARRRRRAQFLRELNEAKALRERVKPRQARAARMRQQMRMRTFRW